MEMHPEERGLTFTEIEKKTTVLRPVLQSNQSSLCSLHSRRRGVREEDQIARSTAYIEQLMEEDRYAGRLLMIREKKYRAKNGSLQNTSTESKGATFVILINHVSSSIRGKNGVEQAQQGGRPVEISL